MRWVVNDPNRVSHPARKGDHAYRYVHNCIADSSAAAIANVETRMKLLDTGDFLFPVSVNAGDEPHGNSYVVSPLTTYTGYAVDELRRMNRPWVSWPAKRLINIIGRRLIAARVDRLVQVNNWLLSTNLYPYAWDGLDLGEVKRFMVDSFPDHAIAFRSLNRFSNSVLIDRLESMGFVAIPSRQVYIFDARDGDKSNFLRRHNTRIDAKLLQNTSYESVDGDALSPSDYSRLEGLYNQLYLEKYSQLNPQFKAEWLRCGQADGWLKLQILRTTENRIDGVVGWFSNEKVLTAPIVGYDTSLPQSLGLYRLLTQMCLQESVRRRCVLNFSSGAALFKRLRGGQPEIEYSMVFVDHLNAQRVRAWRLLGRVLHSVGIPIMKKLKL